MEKISSKSSGFVPSDKVVARLLQRRDNYNRRVAQQLKDLQDKCKHIFKKLDSWNDHDGWSWMAITWYTRFRCEKCGFERTETSESQYG